MGRLIDEYEDIKTQQECVSKTIDTLWKMAQKYQQLQADYETRLKADMVAMLTELQLEIEETAKDAHINAFMNGYKDMYLNGISASAIKCSEIIQQKINSLKEA